ncbi:MAG: hypothetical protein A2Y62_12370 [Candidatus Fischerbacteria bacterium RBG_13_37_8]|uniref:Uncharacterized protein n=1 Tax=Candidatus Fischerbacteria bacterium RBG_13_37_8 TaxID=1817863 RepID=A0A1F5VSQ1_9BACT|nr:MAG: hypothetical protein A2Y62_12370 [Candidatus Fischerbacteria bacterium RBG_13_37_8]
MNKNDRCVGGYRELLIYVHHNAVGRWYKKMETGRRRQESIDTNHLFSMQCRHRMNAGGFA